MPLSNLLLSVHPHNSDKKVLMVFLDIHSHYTEGEGVMEITASKVQRVRGWWCRLKIYIFSFFTNFYFEWNPSPKAEFCSYEMDVAKGAPAQLVSPKWGADGRNLAAAILQNSIGKFHNLPYQLTKGIPAHVGKQFLLSPIWQFPICNSSNSFLLVN